MSQRAKHFDKLVRAREQLHALAEHLEGHDRRVGWHVVNVRSHPGRDLARVYHRAPPLTGRADLGNRPLSPPARLAG